MAIGDRALGLAPSAYLQLGGRALLRLPVHVHPRGLNCGQKLCGFVRLVNARVFLLFACEIRWR